MQNNDIYMINCPNCKQPTIECSNEDGLLTDWCDKCDTSIFADPKDDTKQ